MQHERDALPMDSDLEVVETEHRPRPVHLRPAAMAVVAAGGAAGTAARVLCSLAVPDVAGIPVSVLGINVVGALLLGLLLEALARSGPDRGLRQRLRLLLGTGFCGGFTTYSSLAATSAVFISSGLPWDAAVYGVLTVGLGFLGSLAGIGLGSLRGRRAAR
ncbi:fluoride efflux transporter FluC [Amnibacterium sp.]|uniref:fluoride efflux transporter FluC n=1 Tax=Amnibacterium sp. TaxID=1872496 RepID=UPI003F7C44AB